MFKIYNNAYENRQKSDYSIATEPEKEDVIISLRDSKKFVERVKSYIKEKM